MSITIHIIMANHNRGQFIAQAIQSVLDQTSPHWFLHIGDDGSTDDSWEVIQSFLPHAQIEAHRLPGPRGIVPTEDFLFRSCPENAFMGILDSDDWLSPVAIESMLEAIRQNPNGEFFHSRFEFCAQDGSRTGKTFGAEKTPDTSHLTHPYISHFKVFNKSLYARIGGLDPRMLYGTEDVDFILRAEENTQPIYLPFVLYYYRRHAQSITIIPHSRRMNGLIKHWSLYLAWRRRLNTPIPNFSRIQIAWKMFLALGYASRYRYWKNAREFLGRLLIIVLFLEKSISPQQHSR